jgi:large subunit ribosomal protein L24
MQATKRIKAPRKQRKLLYNAPAHLRHKLMAAPLAPQLTASKNVKALPVRKGDTVRIMRGDNKGFEGKISRVDLKNYRIYIEGLTREKVDGTAIFLPVHPSKVMIKNLNLSDKWRKAIVERKEELPKKEAEVEKAVEKPPKIVEKAKVAKKPPAKAAKVEKEKEVAEEKPVKVKGKVAEAKVAMEKKPEKAKPKAKPATAPTKAQKKPAPKKKKEEKPMKEEKPTKKEKKPSAAKTAKKTRAKRKAISEKEGGT